MHTLCRRVKDAVHLHTTDVADDYPWGAPVVELANVVEILDERGVAEDVEVIDRRLAPMPSLVWCLAVKRLGGQAV